MNRDVFLFLLALDSYNRGCGANVEIGGAKGSEIGTAVIGENADTLLAPGAAQEAGFYAIAYEWYGETIIPYRGTNFGSSSERSGSPSPCH